MIDIKALNEYSRFLNLKQVCDSAGVNYSNIHHKIQRHREGRRAKLTESEANNLSHKILSLGESLKKISN